MKMIKKLGCALPSKGMYKIVHDHCHERLKALQLAAFLKPCLTVYVMQKAINP